MFNEVFKLMDAMDKMFDPSSETEEEMHYNVPSFPPVFIYISKNGEMVFKFSLAGYKKEDLQIEFKENGLELSTVDNYECPVDSGVEKIIAKNIKTPKFNYFYYVSTKYLNVDKAIAQMKDGILEISIPRKEQKENPKSRIMIS